MKQLTCEMCGSNDLVKQEGVFVCQSCGCKYSVEEAKKMMVEGTVEVTGTVKVDSSASIENFLKMATTAHEIGNYDEAKEYYSKVLEMQPTNCEALVGKGVSELYSSNLADIRSDELIGYISKAIEYKKKEDVSDTEINTFIEKVAGELYSAAIVVFQASQSHYNEYWKLESSAPEYWDRLSKVIKIFLFVIALTEDANVQAIGDGEFHYVEGMKFVALCCVEICKQRQYVSGIINPGQLLETEEKTEIKPNEEIHQTYMDLYDNMCSKIKEIEPDYQPDAINRNKQIQGGCYVATCVYGSYDCPQVWTLRRFRDNTLAETMMGRAFIRTYYAISPTLVRWFGDTSWFKKMWKGTLDRIVSKLQANGVEDTPYQDRNW